VLFFGQLTKVLIFACATTATQPAEERIKGMQNATTARSARNIVSAVLCLVLLPKALLAVESQPGKLQFNRDVRPILSDTCFRCHGFDKPARKGDLRLDIRDEAIKIRDGVAPIVPGNPDKSDAYRRMISEDPDEMMPPPKSKLTLTDAQKAVIKLWIQQGAEYQPHWAFIPVKRPDLPAVKLQGWARNDLDRFVLAKLESVGLAPSPEADRRTLIRRVSLDLIGLPPTPAEVDAFLADTSPNAYEKVVDRLLASPRYGERMAMYWLDGARYADSNGYQADYQRFMSPWRDWVINAFNQNEPFDQFTIDQLAGDLLPNATLQQKLATGFNRNHRINTEAGTIAEEWHVETVIDRVETTSNVWLGLTIGCCRCHDHKYDPITQKEFYQFYSFFNNIPDHGNGDGVGRPINNTPVLMLPRPGDETTLAQLQSKLADDEKLRDAAVPVVDAAQTAWEKSAGHLTGWGILDPVKFSSAGGARFRKLADKSLLLSGANPATDVQEIRFNTNQTLLTGLRLEAMQDKMLPDKGPGRAQNANFVLTNIEVEAAPLNSGVQPGKIALSGAAADYSQDNFAVAGAIDSDPKTGWAIGGSKGSHVAAFAFAEPVGFPNGTELRVRLHYESGHPQHVIGRLRISVTTSSSPLALMAPSAKVVEALRLPSSQRSAGQKTQITDYYRGAISSQWKQLQSAVDKAQQAHDDFQASIPNVMVMQEMPKPRESYILIRGQYDRHGDPVTPGTPAALPKMPPGAPMNRLGLAQWIVDPGNPLTARVWVNRAWERFFGIGIVKTSENMGVQADPPSNQDLLDWLAAEFLHPTSTTSGGTPATAWDMKALQKTIVMSATYRQSSTITPQLEELDPDNRLLARGPRFRLQAEMVRDNALAVAGLLVDKLGGDPVRPYQPNGVWDELTEYGNLRHYQHDKGEGLYRRSLYTIWKRTAAPPQMTTFDMPSREICVVKRSRTNTPLQALVLLNDVTYVEASRALAQRMLEEGGTTPESRLSYGFRLATARIPSDDELQVLDAGLKRHEAVYRSDVEAAKTLLLQGDSKPDPKLDPSELAAYSVSASVILNLDETITKE
jgi:hypothetical protein